MPPATGMQIRGQVVTLRVGVGIIGTGVGLRSIEPAFRAIDGASVVALSGSSAERTRALAAGRDIPFMSGDYRELCDHPDVDLVCIASPNEFHVEHAMYAIRSGKHVYLEKPVGLSASDAVKLAGLEASMSPSVVVGHQLRFNPMIVAVRDAIRDGRLGRIYHVGIRQEGSGFTDPDRAWTWELESEETGGVRLAMGSHVVDLLGYLTRSEPTAVFAATDPVHAVRRVPGEVEPRPVAASAYVSAGLSYPTFSAQVSSTAASHGPFLFDVTVLGELADLRWDGVSAPLLHRHGQDPEPLVADAVVAEFSERPGTSIFSKSFGYLASAMVDSVRSGQPLGDAADLRSSVVTSAVLDALLHSARSGGSAEVATHLGVR